MLVALSALCITASAGAQEYPNKPVKFLVPFAPGGPTDVVARIVAQKLTENLGQSFIVENRTGATGTIASGAVAKAAPDGYTLLVASLSSHISPYLLKTAPYDPARDFTPIINMANLPFYFVANPKVPANTLGEFIALAKKNPGSLNFGSPGAGSAGHLCVEMFMTATGTKLTHVPYKGAAPAVAALIGGEINFICDSISTSQPHVKGGKLRGLALTSPKRFAAAAEIPTTAEAGLPNFEASIWFALFGPANTPPTVVTKLNTEISRIMDTPDMRERIISIGGEYQPNTAEQFAAFLKADVPKWIKVINDVGVKVD
jgi:tripartite-type tricarboxylate transporter receptor subunit TctC